MLVAKYKLGVPRPPQALFRQGSMTQGRIYYRHLLLHTTIPTHALRNSLLTPGRHTHSQETWLIFKKPIICYILIWNGKSLDCIYYRHLLRTY